MKAVRMMVDNGVGLNRATVYAGASKTSWYRAAKRSTINPGGGGNRAQALGDMRLKRAICGIIKKRPFYGTRRMAAQIRRETGVRVNRKVTVHGPELAQRAHSHVGAGRGGHRYAAILTIWWAGAPCAPSLACRAHIQASGTVCSREARRWRRVREGRAGICRGHRF